MMADSGGEEAAEVQGSAQVLAKDQDNGTNAFIAIGSQYFFNLQCSHIQRLLVVIADRAFAVQHAGKGLQVHIGGSGYIGRVQYLELHGGSGPYGGILAAQVFFCQGMELVADAQGEYGEDQAVQEIIVQGIQGYILERIQAFDAGNKQ